MIEIPALDFHYYFHKEKLMVEGNSNRPLRILEWYKDDGENVKRGDKLFVFGNDYMSYRNTVSIDHFAEQDGFISIEKGNSKFDVLIENDHLYSIYSSNADRIGANFINIPDIIIDDFTGKKIIKWKQVGDLSGYQQSITTYSTDKLIALRISFNHLNEKDYIMFSLHSKDLKLSVNDTISFLFEDNHILSFVINEKAYKSSHPYIKDLYESKVIILDDELLKFQDIKLQKWKIHLKQENREIIGGNIGLMKYTLHHNLIEVIKKLAREYRTLVRQEIENYKPAYIKENLTVVPGITNACFVYLMHDIVNDFYKIGISNQPQWREKTLQSEKPTIELLASKKYINRKIASAFEKSLHQVYLEKRIRGEWFKLDAIDVDEIVLTLKN